MVVDVYYCISICLGENAVSLDVKRLIWYCLVVAVVEDTRTLGCSSERVENVRFQINIEVFSLKVNPSTMVLSGES